MSRVDISYNRDESNINICPAWVIYTMPLVFVIVVVSLILALVYHSMIFLCVFALSYTWSLISDKIFSMHERCRITFKRDSVVYQYDLNRSVMPSSNVTTTIVITDISKIKVKRNSVVIRGSMTRKAPLKKCVSINKVEVPINFNEREEIIEKMKERIK